MSDYGAIDPDIHACDREPIHVPGRIQAFGFLLGLDDDWRVTHVSANIEDFIGRSVTSCLGMPLDTIFESDTVHLLRNQLAMLQPVDSVQRCFGLLLRPDGPLYDVAIHQTGAVIVVEAEPAATDEREAAALVRAMIARLKHTPDLQAFLRDSVRHVQALIGFDRVMVYRFDQRGDGEVVAEALRGRGDSFMGLHYPSTDIPAQARALYLRNAFRIIADVSSDSVGIVRDADSNEVAFDQSISVLRAVSRVHIEYLRNMGVAASLSISIVVDGKLWGLFVCHHPAARLPSFAYRTAAELFGEMFSMMLESRLRREAAESEARAHALGDLLIAEVAYDSRVLTDAKRLAELILPVIPAGGLAVRLDGAVCLEGETPSHHELVEITTRLSSESGGANVVTEHLPNLIASAASYADVAAGMLAIPMLPGRQNYLFLFRPEISRTIAWAGEPLKHSDTQGRLTPRASFAAWTQSVSGTCLPFTATERSAAETIRLAILQARTHPAGQLPDDGRAKRSDQDVLIAELNHRVRNILALIRGLISQTRMSGETAENFIATLDDRVQSLARAHDQITSDQWGPARLSELINTEAGAYLLGKQDRLRVSGPDVLIQPAAFTTLALVFHELMTNAAKYGALSETGRVTIDWSIDDHGALKIDWLETGGPKVSPPTRRGFGSTIIERSIPFDLGGEAKLSFAASGFCASFVLPARHLAGFATERRSIPAVTPVADSAILLGATVLLVEDSLIIAMDCEDTLRSLGAATVVTTATVADALAAIESHHFQFALLDFNLGDETSVAVADVLCVQGVPFAFATGYDGSVQEGGHANAPVIGKPYGRSQLMPVLARLGFGAQKPTPVSAAIGA